MKKYINEINIAKEAVLKSGKFLVEEFNKRHNVTIKPDNTELLDEDIKSENILVDAILKNFPSDSIFTEESEHKISSDRVWAFDPICGSYSYLRGVDTWSVSMALIENNKMLMGVVLQPLLNNLYWGVIGEGAYLNGKEIKTSSQNEINKCFISVEHGVFNSGKLRILDLIKDIKRIRVGHGSGGELAYTAAGGLDAVIKTDQTLVHFAGGRAVLEAAGGIFYNFNGEPVPVYFDKNKKVDYIAAANKNTFNLIKNYII